MADSLKSARNAENTKSPKGQAIRHRPFGHRILRTFIEGSREYQFHATKGWRSYRVTP